MQTVTFNEIAALSLWGTTADNDVSGRHPQAGQQQNLQDVLTAIQQTLPDATDHERARLRHRLGYLALLAGDGRTKAIEAFTLAREGAIKTQDRALEGLALCGLSTAYDHVGRRHESLQCAEEAEAIAQELGDDYLLALALNDRAQFYKENGKNVQAQALYERILTIGKTLGDLGLQTAAHIGMGRTTAMIDASKAIEHYETAIALAQSRGNDAALALAYNNLSDWMIYTGQYQKAIEMREECLRLARQHQLRPLVGRALIGMAKAYTHLGELEKARELLNKGFPTVVSSGDIEGDLHSSLNLAYLYLQTGDVPRSTELYRNTLERSLAAPDHACAVFAQKALDLLADGQIPAPGIGPERPVTEEFLHELNLSQLDGVVAARGSLALTYPTGDQKWSGGM